MSEYEMMPKSQYDFIHDIETYMLDSTNMTESEAYDYAFRTWQCKEWLRNKLNASADVAPVRHGRWEVIDAEEPRRYGCSICRRLSWYMENYCPNCGAKMDEEENDGDQ